MLQRIVRHATDPAASRIKFQDAGNDKWIPRIHFNFSSDELALYRSKCDQPQDSPQDAADPQADAQQVPDPNHRDYQELT